MDHLLVNLGLAETRAKARALILSGRVLVENQQAPKAGTLVPASVPVELKPGRRFVSRGGEKLAGALDAFLLSPAGKICLDIGASTGGFTDCLLQRGAVFVYAVDVGRGQIHSKLRQNERVDVREGRHALSLRKEELERRPDFVVIDVSFISIRRILTHLPDLLTRPADIVGLVKPQFEVGRKHLKKGVVRSVDVQKEAVADVIHFAGEKGYKYDGQTPSKLKGPKGNQEYFIHLAWQPT